MLSLLHSFPCFPKSGRRAAKQTDEIINWRGVDATFEQGEKMGWGQVRPRRQGRCLQRPVQMPCQIVNALLDFSNGLQVAGYQLRMDAVQPAKPGDSVSTYSIGALIKNGRSWPALRIVLIQPGGAEMFMKHLSQGTASAGPKTASNPPGTPVDACATDLA
jgi:hypothetical protein